jgi:hypothetical protein
MTNGYGEVVFHARYAGSDPSPALLLSSDGVNLGRVVGRSTDLDGQGGGTRLLDFAAFGPRGRDRSGRGRTIDPAPNRFPGRARAAGDGEMKRN